MSVKETVAYLLDLRARNVTVESLPLELAPKSLAAAYAAQDQLVDKLCGLWGGERAGYKIALTSAMAQSLTAIDHPVFGRIISSRVYASGTALPANLFTTRVVESEFAFTIGHDVPKRAAAYTANSIAPFVDAVHPAIELVDCHFAGLDRVTGVSLAADNAIHGAFVCGEACDADDLMQLNNARVELEVNGEVLLTGAGDRTLGHPLKAL
ncbi:MAG: hypothetical protein HOI95_00345, partial [Chromatiales bacterium]|nr:hypothetical protein [Chromatiales bacterium]